MSAFIQTGFVTGPTSSVDGDLAVFSGTSGKVITNLPTAGTVVQVVVQEYSNWSSSSLIIPMDNTIPQIGEGGLLMSATITPQFANSRFRLIYSGNYTQAVAGIYSLFAIFRNSVANAIVSVVSSATTANHICTVVMQHFDPAQGSIAAITYSVRYGPNATGGVYVNGGSGTAHMGLTEKCVLTVEEIRQ